MGFHHVAQEKNTGCFVACVAILMDQTYAQAFSLIHPSKDILDFQHGLPHVWNGDTANSVAQVAQNKLTEIGIKSHIASSSNLKRIVVSTKKPIIAIIRWKDDPLMCHAVVFDAHTKKFVDPSWANPDSLASYAHQTDSILVIDELPSKG